MLSDLDIINGCKEGRESAYKALVDQYASRLMATALRYLRHKAAAEDAVQECYIRVFQSIHKYDHKDQLYPWLNKICVNQCLKELRNKVISMQPDGLLEVSEIPENQRPEGYEDAMQLALNNLPEAYRLVFNLNVADGYAHAEIAALLGITESTSRVYLTRARTILKSYLIKLNNTGYVSGVS